MHPLSPRSSPHPAPPVGLIAGAGDLPIEVAHGIRAAGRRLAVVGLQPWASTDLRQLADRFCWRGILRVGGWIRTLRRAGCEEVIMVGRVRKSDMFAMPRWKQWLYYLPDLTSIRIWYGVQDRRNDSLLTGIADALAAKGLTMIDSTTYIPEAMAEEGVLTAGKPSSRVLSDADFAWPILKQVAGLDIGQSIAVKEREIIAVEAIEGTDKLIERAGQLCPQGGWTLVKVAKPNQDMRFDVPTIGLETIENLARNKAAGLVIQAGKTILLQREQTLQRAGQLGIAVIGRRDRHGEKTVEQAR
jgi:DUF1009 family protein